MSTETCPYCNGAGCLPCRGRGTVGPSFRANRADLMSTETRDALWYDRKALVDRYGEGVVLDFENSAALRATDAPEHPQAFEKGGIHNTPRPRATDVPVAEGLPSVDALSFALQRGGMLSRIHMSYADSARCVLAALTDGRDDHGSPDEHKRHALARPEPDRPPCGLCGHTYTSHLLGVACCDCIGYATECPHCGRSLDPRPYDANRDEPTARKASPPLDVERLRRALHKAVDAPFRHPLNDNVRRSRIHAAIDSTLATPEPDA